MTIKRITIAEHYYYKIDYRIKYALPKTDEYFFKQCIYIYIYNLFIYITNSFSRINMRPSHRYIYSCTQNYYKNSIQLLF